MTDTDKTPPYDSDKINEGGKVPPPREYYSDRIQDALPNPDTLKSWYQRHERKIIVVAVVGGAYFLNKRAVRKVVTKVIRAELTQFAEDEIQLSLSPEWQHAQAQSWVNNGLFNKI